MIGRRGHVEVQGIVEDLQSYEVLQSVEEVRRYPRTRLGVMCQTTTPARQVDAMRQAIAAHNPDADICFIDTVCHPTKDHDALERLLEQVNVVVVVGGRQSNNTSGEPGGALSHGGGDGVSRAKRGRFAPGVVRGGRSGGADGGHLHAGQHVLRSAGGAALELFAACGLIVPTNACASRLSVR